MMQASFLLDRPALRGGSTPSHDAARRDDRPSVTRSIASLFGRDRRRAAACDPLSDHLLRDIGLSRADLQALGL